MNLTVRINGVEYKNCVAQGITFSEEFNETLDSCVCRITHIPRISNLEPYDDVYIYDTDNFDFEHDIQIMRDVNGGTFTNGVVRTEAEAGQYCNNPFYRHFLLDQFTETIIKLGSNRKENICDYALELFSETKRLEKIQLPNLSITQPLNARKRKSVWEYLNIYLGLYSPKIKVVDDATAHTWKYAPKYSLDPSLKARFGDIYCPEFTLSNPTFRDILSQLMIVSDCIPYVRDDVIYAMDISKRGDSFSISDEMAKGRINYITSSKSSDDYCDNVRRQYSQALSKNGTCHYVENLGFRNANQAIMKLDDMLIETTHPIYRIKRLYMCYYKNVNLTIYDADSGTYTTNEDACILIKQDITKLVKLDSEWNLLSQDWSKLDTEAPASIDDLAQYKLTTVKYAQGDNKISGWGMRYEKIAQASYIFQTYVLNRTYIENIFNYMDKIYPFGIYNSQYYLDELNAPERSYISIKRPGVGDGDFVEYSKNIEFKEKVSDNFSSVTKLKTLFFDIEYDGFYNGALVHSRDNGKDQIVANDNSSSSLALLEVDGVNQKEKLNRFANKTHQIQAKIFGLADLLQLAQTTKIGEEDDVIIYKREYSIYDNDIVVNYLAIKNYVLKDYFISVYSKYRTYQLMGYGESINRSETAKDFCLLSLDKKYKSESSVFQNLSTVFSAFEETPAFVNISGPEDTHIKGLFLLGGKLKAFTNKDKISAIRVSGDRRDFDTWIQFVKAFDIKSPYTIVVSATVSLQPNVPILTLSYDSGTGIYQFTAWHWYGGVATSYVLVEIDSNNSTVSFQSSNESFPLYREVIITSVNMPSGWDGVLIGEDIKRGCFAVDSYLFTSGNMLCANLRMRDNVSGGNFIEQIVADYSALLAYPADTDENYIIGTLQDFYDITDDSETGTIKDISYYLYFANGLPAAFTNQYQGTTDYTDFVSECKKILAYPKVQETIINYTTVPEDINAVIVYKKDNPYVDNKELLDETFSIEPYTQGNDCVVSPWLVKLNGAIGNYWKTFDPAGKDYNFYGQVQSQGDAYINIWLENQGATHTPYFGLSLDSGDPSTILQDIEEDVEYTVECKIWYNWISSSIESGEFSFNFNCNSLLKTTENNESILIVNGAGTYTKPNGDVQEYTQLIFTESGIYGDNLYYWKSIPAMQMEFSENLGVLMVVTPTSESVHLYQNCFVRVGDDPIDRRIVFEEHKGSTWVKDRTQPATEFEKSFAKDEQTQECLQISQVFIIDPSGDFISVDLGPLGGYNAMKGKSIQYWYFDDASAYTRTYNVGSAYTYDPTASAYHFVFGVNIPDNLDNTNNHADVQKIYLTTMTNRDSRVFSTDTGEVIGEINNCIVNGQYHDLGYTYSDIQ